MSRDGTTGRYMQKLSSTRHSTVIHYFHITLNSASLGYTTLLPLILSRRLHYYTTAQLVQRTVLYIHMFTPFPSKYLICIQFNMRCAAIPNGPYIYVYVYLWYMFVGRISLSFLLGDHEMIFWIGLCCVVFAHPTPMRTNEPKVQFTLLLLYFIFFYISCPVVAIGACEQVVHFGVKISTIENREETDFPGRSIRVTE